MVQNITDNSKKHPFLDPIYITTLRRGNPMEYSRNILWGQAGSEPYLGLPGARVGTVYSAKRMIESEIGTSTP
jgi:hypothetical protein